MAFVVFPAEVWEVILDNLMDSQDVLNTFTAFPELETKGVLKTKRHLWLFDRVIPHVIPWLQRKEILFCRQVCKQWSHGFDNFLENHPAQRAFNAGSQITGQYWIPEASPAHYHLWDYFKGLKVFKKQETFDEFLQDMEGCPPERNPFVGRSVYIKCWGECPSNTFRNKAQQFLQQFGDKIWFLRVHHVSEDRPDLVSTCEMLLDYLSHTPNLKALKVSTAPGYINGEVDQKEEKAKIFLNSRQAFLPPLPHLETLKMEYYEKFPPSLANFLVRSYSNQVKRLRIRISLWEQEYANLFPNLTELTLSGMKSSGIGISNLLLSLDSPNLWRLKLRFAVTDNETVRFMNEVVPKLQRFPILNFARKGKIYEAKS